MKWVNPPVAYMLHAGVPALMAAGAYFPCLQAPDPQAARIALEAYPGMLAREVLAQDASGDALDAVLCLVQAAWGQRAQAQGAARYGLPADTDPLEGWILGA